MKRILAFVLTLVLALLAVSCNMGSSGGISAKIVEMYNRKSPTKSVTVATYEYDDEVIKDTITLVTGKINGTINVAKLTEIKERLRTVADGSNAQIVPEIKKTETISEYYEGKGVRTKTDKEPWTDWDPAAKSFAPTDGSVSLNITESNIKAVKEEGKKISFTVSAVDTQAVFGVGIASDVKVELAHDGACVVGITLQYHEAATAETPDKPSTPAVKVTIEVVYTYDIEPITVG